MKPVDEYQGMYYYPANVGNEEHVVASEVVSNDTYEPEKRRKEVHSTVYSKLSYNTKRVYCMLMFSHQRQSFIDLAKLQHIQASTALSYSTVLVLY
jgi:hypothetical protein